MPVVKRSSAAENDLLEIYLHIGRDNNSPLAAERLLKAIEEKCYEYAAQPLMGTSRPDLGQKIRVFPCGTRTNPREWIVVYRPIKKGIEVARVFHGKRDYPILFGYPI